MASVVREGTIRPGMSIGVVPLNITDQRDNALPAKQVAA
jgi:hypothetical protein